jgi:hypothetical protein
MVEGIWPSAKFFLNAVSIYDRHSETFELCHVSEGFSDIPLQ